MATHGVEVSRDQSAADIDGWSFAIINAEDPPVGDTLARCSSPAIPWGLSTWIHPGNGRADTDRATNYASKIGTPPLGFWLDDEEDGVFKKGVESNVVWTRAFIDGIPGAFRPIGERIKSGTASTTDVDAEAVAAAIASQLGPDLAKQVLEALQHQLDD